MKTKKLFLGLFVPQRAFVTLLSVRRLFIPPPAGGAVLVKVLSVALALPVPRPLMRLDPDGGRLPGWFQFASVLLHRLAGGLGLLLSSGLANRFAWRRANPNQPQPSTHLCP